MALNVNIAPNIIEAQTDNFYFTVVFLFEEGQSVTAGSFGIEHIHVFGSDDVGIEDVRLIASTAEGAVFSVNLPPGVRGSFEIIAGWLINVSGVQESVVGEPKTVQYNTESLFSESNYDPTPLPTSPSKVAIRLSAAHVKHGGVVVAQFDFDFDVPYFSESHVQVTAGATKGIAESIDDRQRRWIVPITAPNLGEGSIEVSIPENGVGFDHAAVRAEIGYGAFMPLIIEAV